MIGSDDETFNYARSSSAEASSDKQIPLTPYSSGNRKQVSMARNSKQVTRSCRWPTRSPRSLRELSSRLSQ